MPFPYRHHPRAFSSSSTQSLSTSLKASEPSPSFLCTVCWQYQPKTSSPKVLGTSARIVCQACWNAVLDLSICWVCGECIVRGDEVVSLGWCFWHRACFGCLVCGIRMSVENEMTRNGKVIGVELEDIPLCDVCSVETEAQTSGAVLRKSLEMVSRYDGGLAVTRLRRLGPSRTNVTGSIRRRLHGRTRSSEDRWVAERRASKSRSGSGSSKASRGAIRSSEERWDCTKDSYAAFLKDAMLQEDSCSLLKHASEMGVSQDDGLDSPKFSSELITPVPMADHYDDGFTDIYVSIYDPVGQPAFRPSKTKPVPKWMQLLPHNVQHAQKQKVQHESAHTSYHSQEGMTSLMPHCYQDSKDLCEEGPREPASTPEHIRTVDDETSRQSTTSPMNIPPKSYTSSKFAIAFPSTAYGRKGHRRSFRGQSIYMTPPEYPSSPFRHQTPSLGQPTRPSPSHIHESYMSLSIQANKIRTQTIDPCYPPAQEVEPSPVSSQSIQRHDFVVGDFISPGLVSSCPLTTSSTEYLDRYHPRQADSKTSTYVAKVPEPIFSKLKRRKLAEGEGQMNKDYGKNGYKLYDEEYGLDPRRKDLQKELKGLFNEE